MKTRHQLRKTPAVATHIHNHFSKMLNLAALIAVASVMTAHAGVLVNGSFEDGTFDPAGDWTSLDAGSTAITGWTTYHNYVLWRHYPNSQDFQPADGASFVDFGSLSNEPGAITQTIATVADVQYHVSFQLGTNGYGTTPLSGVIATAGDTSLTFDLPPGGAGVQWVERGFNFTATDSETPISFQGVYYDANIHVIWLDNVAVTTAVPEPSMGALIGFGAAALFFVRRRAGARPGLAFSAH